MFSSNHVINQKNCRLQSPIYGSMTVESSVIIPLIVISIIALIYMGLLLHERAVIQAAADRAAEMGSASWTIPGSDVETGRSVMDGSTDGYLYRRIFFAGRNEKLEDIKEYARRLSDGKSLLNVDYTDVQVEIRDYAVYKELEVTVEKSYRLPAGKLLRLFGGDGGLDIRVTAGSIIDDPVELIRNTDFIIDVERELEGRYPELKNLGEKTRGVMGDIKGKIAGFLD